MIHTDPRGEPDADRATRSRSCAAQGKRVIYDAEHFFDGYRDDPDYALRVPRGGARRRRRERHAVRHERLEPAARRSPRRPRAVVARFGAERVGIHTHNDAECGVANSIAAVEEGAASCRAR